MGALARNRKRRSRRPPLPVPIASMGDIAFLLIIFFMITSTFIREQPVELPESQDIERVEQGRVSVRMDEHGQISINGVDVSGPDAVEWGVGALLDKYPEDERQVVFRCDHRLSHEEFEPVLDAIAKTGATITALGDRGGGG